MRIKCCPRSCKAHETPWRQWRKTRGQATETVPWSLTTGATTASTPSRPWTQTVQPTTITGSIWTPVQPSKLRQRTLPTRTTWTPNSNTPSITRKSKIWNAWWRWLSACRRTSRCCSSTSWPSWRSLRIGSRMVPLRQIIFMIQRKLKEKIWKSSRGP